MTLISPGDCTLQCGMWLWNRDSELTKWQHPAMWHVALESWHWIRQVAGWQHPAVWQVALGWHAIEFAQTTAILEFYIRFRFRPHHRSWHVILHQSPKFCRNQTTLSRKNDVMSIFKMADLSHLGFYGSSNGFLKKPMYDFLQVVNRDHSSKLLSFWENHVFFAFWQQRDKQRNEQMDTTDTLSRSRCRERRLNKQVNKIIKKTSCLAIIRTMKNRTNNLLRAAKLWTESYCWT